MKHVISSLSFLYLLNYIYNGSFVLTQIFLPCFKHLDILSFWKIFLSPKIFFLLIFKELNLNQFLSHLFFFLLLILWISSEPYSHYCCSSQATLLGELCLRAICFTGTEVEEWMAKGRRETCIKISGFHFYLALCVCVWCLINIWQ